MARLHHGPVRDRTATRPIGWYSARPEPRVPTHAPRPTAKDPTHLTTTTAMAASRTRQAPGRRPVGSDIPRVRRYLRRGSSAAVPLGRHTSNRCSPAARHHTPRRSQRAPPNCASTLCSIAGPTGSASPGTGASRSCAHTPRPTAKTGRNNPPPPGQSSPSDKRIPPLPTPRPTERAAAVLARPARSSSSPSPPPPPCCPWPCATSQPAPPPPRLVINSPTGRREYRRTECAAPPAAPACARRG